MDTDTPMAASFKRSLQGRLAWGAMGLALGCSLLPTPAAAQSVVVVDASRALRPVLVYGTTATKLPAKAMYFVRLSAPLNMGTECCVRVAGPQHPSRDFEAQGPASAIFAPARLTQRKAPFIGVAFVGRVPRVSREDAHTLLLGGVSAPAARRLIHCLSGETLHIRVVDASSGREQVRYALPLNMDVEADCNEHLMPATPPASDRR